MLVHLLDSCVCRLCRDDISRLCDDAFVPRWNRLKVIENSTCYIQGCTNTVHRVTKVVSRPELFGIPADLSDPSDHTVGTALCIEHYGAMYRLLNPIKNKCRTCDQKIDALKSRRCPEPTENFGTKYRV